MRDQWSKASAARDGQGASRLQVTDTELVRRIRAGDEAAFGELVNRHADGLYRMAYSVMGSAADAEDILQETLLGAFNRLSAFEGRSSVKTWLVRILLNHASKLRRSRRVRKAESLPEQLGPASGDQKYASASPAAAVQSRVDVNEMLQSLSPEHREVIVLRELQQMSYDEIAEALRIPRGTVESRLHRARQELKRRYEGYLT
ncbi:MAG TPA: RNA polymerase sigma factor [Tepidisphaeraceae bacterium]